MHIRPYLSEEQSKLLSTRLGPGVLAERLRMERKKLVWSAREQRFKNKTKFTRRLYLLFAGILKLLNLYEKGLANAARPQIVINRLRLPAMRLPPPGLRILHLSDLHLESNAGLMPLIHGMLRELDFDLALLTGDITSTPPGPGWKEQFALLPEALKCPLGAFAVLGNHDSIALVPLLEARGIRFLLNENVTLKLQKSTIGIAGVEDSRLFKTDDLKKSLRFAAQPDAVILLSHSPDLSRQAAECGVDLYLCGHTHGGQICLRPGLPVVTMSKAPRERVSGPWRIRQMQGYTSRGSGSSVPPVRFNCPPEITIHHII